jgi:hypothetical protein
VFSEDDRLVGVFCKYIIDGTNVYGLVLPTIYILKTLWWVWTICQESLILDLQQ